MVESCWQAISRHFARVTLDAFVVMPNHVHGIIIVGRGEALAASLAVSKSLASANASPLRAGTQPDSLAAIVQNFKSVSARKINALRRTPGIPVWQRNYYERIIRSEREWRQIRQYIANNPLRWARDHENPVHQKT